MSFAQQVVADAALVTTERNPTRANALAVGQRMERLHRGDAGSGVLD